MAQGTRLSFETSALCSVAGFILGSLLFEDAIDVSGYSEGAKYPGLARTCKPF
jgi:hypothetical protein